MLRREFLLQLAAGTVAAVGPSAISIRSAFADESWCAGDPLIIIVTPGGNRVPVYVEIEGKGLQHQAAVDAAVITYQVHHVPGHGKDDKKDKTKPRGRGNGGTNVDIEVLVPGDTLDPRFPVRSVASTGPGGTGTVYDRDEGRSGRPMHLKFALDIT